MDWLKRILGLGGPSEEPQPPQTAQEHTELGNKYWFENKKADAAIGQYKEALRVAPDYSLARSNLGSLYLQEDRIDEAIAEFEEALRRGIPQALIRHNTETWLAEATAIREGRQERIGDVDASIREYIQELGGPCNRLRVVYEKLTELGPPAAEALISAMRTANAVLSNRVFELLGQIGDERALEPLKSASRISEKEFRSMTGDTGRTRTVNLSGMSVDVKVSDLHEEYRQRAKEALEKIKAVR